MLFVDEVSILVPSGSMHLSQRENNSIHLVKFHATSSIHISPPHQGSRYLFNSCLISSPSFTLLVQFTSHILTKFHATCSIHVSPPHHVSRYLVHSRRTSSPKLILFTTRCTVNFDHGNHILPSSLAAIIQSLDAILAELVTSP